MRHLGAQRNNKKSAGARQRHAIAGNVIEERSQRSQLNTPSRATAIDENGSIEDSQADRSVEPPPPVAPGRTNHLVEPSAAGASTSRIVTTPVLPQQRQGRQNILAPLRLNLNMENALEESQGSSNGQQPTANDLAAEVRSIKDMLTQQARFNEQLKEMLDAKERENQDLQSRGKKKWLPKALTACVREAYKMLAEDQEDGTVPITWDFTKCYDDNNNINGEIFRAIRSTDNETSTATVKAAMRVHFRTKKREFNLKKAKSDKAVLKAQRRRSRLNTKMKLRKKALEEATSISQEEKDRYRPALTVDYMSSEHTVSEESASDHDNSDEEPPSKGKEFTIHPLPWRSTELNRVFEALDRRVVKKRGPKGRNMLYGRKKGADSSRDAAIDAPAWAVKN